MPSDDDAESKKILPKKIQPYTSGKKAQDIDWYAMLNSKLLASSDVTHGAIIDVDDHENLKAGNFQPSIMGKSLFNSFHILTVAVFYPLSTKVEGGYRNTQFRPSVNPSVPSTYNLHYS